HQIGTVVSYTTSMQNLGADPQNILTNPAVDVIKSIPVDWDETIALPPSRIGSLVAFARRSGSEWFICVLNGDETEARRLDLPLTFLCVSAVKFILPDSCSLPIIGAKMRWLETTHAQKILLGKIKGSS